MKKLIVTADDFGYSQNVNKAIIKCFRNGIVTSTSLLANTKYFDESVKLLKQDKNLDVGIHINLTESKPLTKAKTLTDKSGNFIHKTKWFDGHYDNADPKELENEIEAQIKRSISSGVKITHMNGHNHIHIFPKVIDAAARMAKKYSIKYLRLPIEKMENKDNFAVLIGRLSKMAECKTLKNSLKMTDAFYGIDDMHDMSFKKFSEILKSLKGGASELMVHPAYIDKSGDRFHQLPQREREIKLLTSEKIKKLIEINNIKMVNFSQL